MPAFCLVVAVLTGGVTLLPDAYSFWLHEPWSGILRVTCVVSLFVFAVSFMVGLDRRSLVKS